MKKFFRQLLTEPDNETFCVIRIVASAGIFQYLGITLAHYIQHSAFDPQGFAVGFGALVAGTGAALGMKKDTKPQG